MDGDAAERFGQDLRFYNTMLRDNMELGNALLGVGGIGSIYRKGASSLSKMAYKTQNFFANLRNSQAGGRSITLQNGYYQVDGGLKMSQKYYEKLWNNGRPAPFLQAEEILKSRPKISPDPMGRAGFKRYEANNLEMIFNPKTKEIWHIQPVRK